MAPALNGTVWLQQHDDDSSIKNSFSMALKELFKLEFVNNMTSQNDSIVCDNKTFIGSFYPLNIKNREWDFLRVVMMMFVVVLHYIPMVSTLMRFLKTVLTDRRQPSGTPELNNTNTIIFSAQEFYQTLHQQLFNIFPPIFFKFLYITYIGAVVITINLIVYDIFGYEYDIEGVNEARCADGNRGNLDVYFCPWYNYRHYYSMWKSFLISLLLATFLYSHVIHTNNIKFSEGSFFDCFHKLSAERDASRNQINRKNTNESTSIRTIKIITSDQTENHYSCDREILSEPDKNNPTILICIQITLIITLTGVWYIFYGFYDGYMALRIFNRKTGERVTETKLKPIFGAYIILLILLTVHFIVLSLVSIRVLIKTQLQKIPAKMKQTDKVVIVLNTIVLAVLTGGLVSRQDGKWQFGWRRIQRCGYMLQCLFRMFGVLLYVISVIVLSLQIDVGF